VLLTELRECGYAGGYTMLKVFVASLKPPETAEPVIRFETEPGEQMQVDWAVIRRDNRLSVFLATLGWSRAAYVEFVTDERVETLRPAPGRVASPRVFDACDIRLSHRSRPDQAHPGPAVQLGFESGMRHRRVFVVHLLRGGLPPLDGGQDAEGQAARIRIGTGT